MAVSRKQKHSVIETLSKEFALPMDVVQQMTDRYADLVTDRVERGFESFPDLPYGVMTLDSWSYLKPGCTLIYGQDSSGKSSLAKRIARSARFKGCTVLYVDADHKLTAGDKEYLRGCYLTGATEAAAVHHIFHNRLVDVLIIDTITAMLPKTQQYLIHHARKSVPYIVIVGQMRYDMESNRMVPAVWDSIASGAYQHIHLTNHEQIDVDGCDMTRVYAQVSKTNDVSLRNGTTAWMVKNHEINNVLTGFDLLQCAGRIQSVGPVKYLDGEEYGSIHDITAKGNALLHAAWQSMTKGVFDEYLYECGPLPELSE